MGNAILLMTGAVALMVVSFAEVAAFHGVVPRFEKVWRLGGPARIAIAMTSSWLIIAVVYYCGSWLDSRIALGSRRPEYGAIHTFDPGATLIATFGLTIALFAVSGLVYTLFLRDEALDRVTIGVAVVTLVGGWPLSILAVLFMAYGSVTNW